MPRHSTVRLSDALIRSYRTDRQVDIFDSSLPAFGVRFSPGGSKAFFVKPRINGKQRRITLGRYPALPLADARKAAHDCLAQARAGLDPDSLKRHSLTFGEVLERYLTNNPGFEALRPRSRDEYRRILRGTYLDELRGRVVARTSATEIRSCLARLATDAPVMANRVAAVLKAAMGWAVDTGVIEQSPTGQVRRPVQREAARSRVLSDAELGDLLDALGPEGPFRPLLTLLLLTAQRREEIAGLRWSEVQDLDGADPHLMIEVGRMKNRLPNYVPLSPAAAAVLRALPRRGDHVFTSNGRRPLSGFSRMKARLDERIARARQAAGLTDMAHWTFHDFRRTAATVMAERLDVADSIVEEVLAHKRPGVAGIYNRAIRRSQRRAALEKWAAHLAGFERSGAGRPGATGI